MLHDVTVSLYLKNNKRLFIKNESLPEALEFIIEFDLCFECLQGDFVFFDCTHGCPPKRCEVSLF